MYTRLAKLLLVLFLAFIAVICLTVMGFAKIAAKAGTGAAVDILYVVTRPLYLLEVVVVLAIAAWVCWRWVLS
jgi:hypothetical protein